MRAVAEARRRSRIYCDWPGMPVGSRVLLAARTLGTSTHPLCARLRPGRDESTHDLDSLLPPTRVQSTLRARDRAARVSGTMRVCPAAVSDLDEGQPPWLVPAAVGARSPRVRPAPAAQHRRSLPVSYATARVTLS